VNDESNRSDPPTLMGTVYWKDHVVAVVDDPAEAERAAAALVAAGSPADGTRAFPGAEVVRHHEAYLAHRNPLQRLGAALASDEGEIADEFVDEAREGHSIVVAPAAEPAAAERVAGVLRGHHAHHIKHYRDNTIADL
jgi:hypothetical protein